MNKEQIKKISDDVENMSERQALQVIVMLLLELIKKGK